METSDVTRAIAAATSVAASLGVPADDAIVLHNSNRLALRLTPCDVVARVAHVGQEDFGHVLVLNSDRTVIESSEMCRRPRGHGVPAMVPISTDTTKVFRFADFWLILARTYLARCAARIRRRLP